MTIGQRIMQIRISCGLSQEEFGEKLGTSRQTVSKWELDITIPEVEKIVKISRLFSVTTDSILVDGISTFDNNGERFVCGIYRSDVWEIAETERVALVYHSTPDRTAFGVKVYTGFDYKKELRAVCEYNTVGKTTEFAYTADTGAVLTNSEFLPKLLGEKFNPDIKKRLYRSEAFFVSHDHTRLTVSKDGIKNCLMQWRMSTVFHATSSRFSVFLCTDKTEYAFDIAPEDTNIYCAISHNTVTDLGLLAGRQFFRIRNYRDNTAPFCGAFCELGSLLPDIPIPTMECVGSACVNTSAGLFFGVKRYTDDEIILCGCNGDEYRYSGTDKKLEKLTSV